MKWLKDFHNGNECHLFRVKKRLARERSRYQLIEVVDTYEYGKCLFLDGKIQVSEKDEYIYHELLVHPAMVTHPDPEKVLIIGGGDGFILREVLKYDNVKEITVIDIDKKVIDITKKYMHEESSCLFDDVRVLIKYTDGRKFLEVNKEKYDVIITDLSEPLEEGASTLLFTREFYSAVSKALKKGGIASVHAISPVGAYKKIHIAIHNTLCYIFRYVKLYYGFVPSFNLQWGFAIASKVHDPEKLSKAEVRRRLRGRKVKGLRYYDETLHRGLFAIPRDIRTDIKNDRTIITDKHPMWVK